jgi:fructokinase
VLGGGPFNAALALARLGGDSAFLGHVSTDVFGRRIRAALVGDGVSLELVRTTDRPTTLAVAEIGPDGGASYSFYTEGTSGVALAPEDARAPLPAGTRALHVGTLALTLEPSASSTELLVESVADDVLLFVDPNCRPSVIHDGAAYRARIERVAVRADVVKLSVEDLAFLYPGPRDRGAGRLLALGASVVLLTDGPEGATIVTGRGSTHVPTAPARVVDTVGAGDSFGAGFLAWWVGNGLGRQELADDAELLDAVRFAGEVARRTCERAGATTPTAAEMEAFAAAVRSGG